MTQHILLVDDELSILRALKRLLRNEPYEIHAANSGPEALKIMETNNIDLIVSDMRMPEMDGAEFLEKAKAVQPSTIRIVLTGYADMDATIRAVNHGGIFGYLSKPWDPSHLKGLIASGLELAEKNRSNELAVTSLIRDHDALKDKVEHQRREMAMADRYVRDTYNALQENYYRMEDVLINLLCLKDPTQREVISLVCEVVKQISTQLCLNEQEQNLLETAAKLHSIGKVALPDSILMKPIDSMDQTEISQYLQYPENSACTLMPFEPYREVSRLVIRQKSYLNDMASNKEDSKTEVCLYARILTAAIDYVDFRTGHMTGSAMTHDQAIVAMQDRAIRYDERVTALLSTITMKIDDSIEDTEILVPVMSLRKGMVLNKNLYMPNGTLMLGENTPLTPTIIDQIQRVQRNSPNQILASVKFEEMESASVTNLAS